MKYCLLRKKNRAKYALQILQQKSRAHTTITKQSTKSAKKKQSTKHT
jgi:hypothetical protein